MIITAVDRAAHLSRWRHRALAEKALLTLGMLVLAVALPPFPAAPIVLAEVLACTFWGARVPVKTWAMAAVAPIGFLATGAVPLVISISGHGVGLQPGGLALAGGLITRSLAGLSCLLLLALTTPTSDLITGLRRIGVPRDVVEIALLIYRFLFLLGDTAEAMSVAQTARLGHSNRRRWLHSLGLLIANLLPRAMDRARRLEQGLAARAWQGEMRVLRKTTRPSPVVLATILIAETLTAIAGVCLS